MDSETSPLVPGNLALPWIQEYQRTRLASHSRGTVAVYTSVLHHFTQWIVDQTRKRHSFHLDQITAPTIALYFSDLAAQGYSTSHRKRAISVITHFCQWLVDEKRSLPQNPARGIQGPISTTSDTLPPHPFTLTQRVILQKVIEKDDGRGQALSVGWTLEEIAYYVGNVTNLGTLVVQTPVRYTQVTRAQVKEKLKGLKG